MSRNLTVQLWINRAIVGASALTMAVLVGGTARPGLAQVNSSPLPPTWTPIPTLTLEPTQPIPTSDVQFPTATIIPPIKPLPIEQAALFAPLFFLSKHSSATVYLARTDPNATNSTQVTNTPDNVTAFDVSADGQVAYGTDKGAIAAPNRTTWHSTVTTRDPLRPASMAWSPDGKTLAFTMRASDRDFTAMARGEPSGIFLWAAGGNPVQIISDRNAGTGSYQYSVESWSPDGAQLLIRFDAQVNAQHDYGWIGYDTTAKTTYALARYVPGDRVRFLNAIWLPNSGGILVFNEDTTSPTEPSSGVVIDLKGIQHPLTISLGSGTPPTVISAFHFFPHGSLLALGSSRRDQPLQLYTGPFDAGSATAVLSPIAEAFKLKWPGVLIVTREGFPAYVVDDQYGVAVFKDNRIFAYYPSQLGMNASDTAVYDSTLWPAWEFAPAQATITLPS
ncbi:MAG: TolB family protein [Aggregatilineales bacterium]